MNYHSLGNSELKISEISFGCMSLENDQETVTPLLRKAHEMGINYFDTADLYDKGLNEQLVGTALKPIRDEVLIATKVGNVWREDGSGWDWKPTKELILSGVEASMKRLQTDYIDVYQLHGGTIEDPIDDIIEAFEILKEQGKIRSYGISSIRPNVIRQYIERSNIDSVMMQYSLLDRRPEEFCLNALQDQNISVVTRGSLAKGMLIDKPASDYLGYSEEQVSDMKEALEKTSHSEAAALQFVLRHPTVASAVVGMRTMEQLSSGVESTQQTVPNEQLKRLAELLKPNTYTKHR